MCAAIKKLLDTLRWRVQCPNEGGPWALKSLHQLSIKIRDESWKLNPLQVLGSAVTMLRTYRLDSITMLSISKGKDAVPNRMILGIID